MNNGLFRRRLRTSESEWCLRANALCGRVATRRFFSLISRLGDGVFW